MMTQLEFNMMIGTLDEQLSYMVACGRNKNDYSEANKQTLKHHAEDMIAAGRKILRDLEK